MAQAVKTDPFQVVFLQQPCKMFLHKIRTQKFSHLIQAYVIQIIWAIRFLKQLAESFLLLLFFQ